MAPPTGDDAPNEWPKILPNPDIPGEGNVPIRRLVYKNQIQVLLVSTLGPQISPSWGHKFPLIPNAFHGASNLSEDDEFQFPEVPFNCTGPEQNAVNGNKLESKCNFCIVVNSGSSSDPDNANGMAHFLEHLVHHGSAKYPKDGLLNDFFSSNKGHRNASTYRDITSYYSYFNYSTQSLRLILDIYADLLTNPTLDVNFIKKEILSIENEYHYRRCSIDRRINQLINTLAIPGDHPLKKFKSGSIASLFSSGRESLEFRNEILKFHRAHYRSDNMSLVIQAPAPLDTLQVFVTETFGSIPPSVYSPGPPKNLADLINPYSLKEFNKLITIRPGNSDIHTLVLFWALPPEASQDYKGKPMHYIAELLGHNHPGGLRQFLLSRGWVIQVYVGINPCGSSSNEYVTSFGFTIYLTQKGRDEISEVLEAMFTYIRFVQSKGIQEAFFQKLKSSADLMFRSFPFQNSHHVSFALAKHLFKNYETKHLITGNTLYYEYKPEIIQTYLNELKPDNACYVLVTADSGNFEFMTEKWYGAKYIVQDLEAPMLRKFQTGDKFSGQFYTQSFASSINLDNVCKIESTSSLAAPKWIGTSNSIYMYYHPNPKNTPESIYTISIISSLNPNIARSKAPAFDVFTKMWKQKSEQSSSYVQHLEVGTTVRIGFSRRESSIFVEVVGFKHIAKEVVKSLMDDFFDPNWNEKEEEQLFDIAKELYLHTYYARVAQLHTYARDLYHRIKFIDHLTAVECYEELKKMNFQNFKIWIKHYKSKLCIRANVSGAVTEEQALEVYQNIQQKEFERMTISDIKLYTVQSNSSSAVKIIPMGERCLRIKSLLPKEKPFVLLNYYQMDTPTKESNKITRLICQLIQNTVKYELRTKEQLGYVVSAFMCSDIRNGLGILVMANSDRHRFNSLCHIDKRIENFIKTFIKEKLTRKSLLPHLKAKNIIRDPAYVQQFARNYLLDKSGVNPQAGYRKLSVQVCHENLHMKCDGNCCRASKWYKPLFHIGKVDSEVCLAGPSKVTLRNKDVYFIESIEAFHKYTGK